MRPIRSSEITIPTVSVTSTAPYGRMPAMFSAATAITNTITQNVVEGPSVQRKFLMIADGA